MKAIQKLPDGCTQVESIDLQKDRKTALKVNGLALAAAAGMILLFRPSQPLDRLFDLDSGLGPYVLRFAALLLGTFAYIVLHELTHGAVMRLAGGKQVRFGFTGLYAWAGSEQDYFDKPAYLCVALAPLLLWGALFGVLQALADDGWAWVVWWWQMMNVSGSMGDVYVSARMLPRRGTLWVRDTGVSMSVFA